MVVPWNALPLETQKATVDKFQLDNGHWDTNGDGYCLSLEIKSSKGSARQKRKLTKH